MKTYFYLLMKHQLNIWPNSEALEFNLHIYITSEWAIIKVGFQHTLVSRTITPEIETLTAVIQPIVYTITHDIILVL